MSDDFGGIDFFDSPPISRRELVGKGLALGLSVPLFAHLTEGSALAARTVVMRRVASTQFVYVDGTDAVTLDPHASPDVGYSFNLCRGPAEALVEYGVTKNGVVARPRIAKSWKHNANATVWEFTLNKGVKFQDGTRCNAAAVKANFERILALNLVPATRLGAVKSIKVLNDTTVRFTLPAPNANFIYPMTQMLMISPSAWEAHEQKNDRGQKWAADNIVGSSAYVIQNRVKGSRTVMKKWPGYWRGWKGKHVDTVVVDVATDAATRKLMLTSGQADEANTIASTDLAELSRNPDIVVTHVQAPGVQMAGVRMSGPTGDVNVRRALTYAFDSEGFINSALSGRGDIAHGLIYTQFPYFDKSMPAYKLDIEKAKGYLAQSAYPKGGFSLKFLILPGFAPYQSDMAAVWQAGLKQLDIDLQIQPMASVASYYASVQDPKGAELWAWSGAAQTPDHVFQARRQWVTGYEYPRGVNGGYSNKQFDGLIDKIGATDDPKKLKTMWSQAQKILARDLPFIPFFIPQIYAVRRKGWNGLAQNPFDLVPNYYAVSKA